MDQPEIEYLVSQAISDRPSATNAPLNLYVCKGRIVCGARIVMPKDADFITHVSNDDLENGFNDRQWKLIVLKIRSIALSDGFTGRGDKRLRTVAEEHRDGFLENDDMPSYEDRRREQRMVNRRQVLFGEESEIDLLKGRMRDISSGGISFTCRADNSHFSSGQKIVTRFSVPRINGDNSYDDISFDRIGKICRVSKINRQLNQIAVEFAKPLPFKPAEQYESLSEIDSDLFASKV